MLSLVMRNKFLTNIFFMVFVCFFRCTEARTQENKVVKFSRLLMSFSRIYWSIIRSSSCYNFQFDDEDDACYGARNFTQGQWDKIMGPAVVLHLLTSVKILPCEESRRGQIITWTLPFWALSSYLTHLSILASSDTLTPCNTSTQCT